MKAEARRPKNTLKARETRLRILRAAVELFQEQGFEGTTMRDIARRAGVATGAAYYYFASKEALVLAFYVETHEQIQSGVGRALGTTGDLRERLGAILELRFEQLEPYRTFYGALFRSAADPESAISPFGDETRDIRESAIEVYREALAGSDVKVAADLMPHLPRLLWLYQMGLILFWIYDRSPGQARTRRLTDKSLDLIVGAIKLSRFRVMAPLRKAALDILASLDEPAGVEPPPERTARL